MGCNPTEGDEGPRLTRRIVLTASKSPNPVIEPVIQICQSAWMAPFAKTIHKTLVLAALVAAGMLTSTARAESLAERAAHKQRLVATLPPGTVTLFDQPYVEGAKPDRVPDSIQTLDLYLPPGPGPFPLILFIHGGGWHGGDKEISGADAAVHFVPAGFAVASMDYRLTTDSAPFPAQIQDCFAALIWLRQNAAKYNLNPDKVGVMGHSAGAHLSALMATTGDGAQFVNPTNVSTRVQAAVLWSGPFDLGRERGQWPHTMFVWNPQDPFRTFFPKGAYDETFAEWASPASYVHSNLPPMLMVQGGKDTLVPVGQAVAFADAVKKAGGDVTLRIDPDHGHDTEQKKGFSEAVEFFRRTLK
jgi:acetyl esterase/lipase